MLQTLFNSCKQSIGNFIRWIYILVMCNTISWVDYYFTVVGNWKVFINFYNKLKVIT